MSPSSNDNNIISGADKVALFAKVNSILNSGINIIHPCSLWSWLLIEQWNASSENLSLSRNLGESGHGQDGAVGLVLAHNVAGCTRCGQNNDGRGLGLVRSHHGRDGGGCGVVTYISNILFIGNEISFYSFANNSNKIKQGDIIFLKKTFATNFKAIQYKINSTRIKINRCVMKT